MTKNHNPKTHNKLDVIWNLTRICPYSCKICCINAICARNPKKQKEMRNGQIKIGRELSYVKNLEILLKLKEYPANIKIDFSGGDPLIFDENLSLIRKAISLFGKENIQISSTGYMLDNKKLDLLKEVGYIEFTVDTPPDEHDNARPIRYNRDSIQGIEKCLSEGINCGISTVIRRDNILNGVYERLSCLLRKYNLYIWHLLRLHPAGRAKRYQELIPKERDYHLLFAQLGENIENTRLHHSFHEQCQASKGMIGILPDGTVLSCCWALNEKGEPINDLFVLGNLAEQRIDKILASNKSYFWNHNKYKGCMTDLYLQDENK